MEPRREPSFDEQPSAPPERRLEEVLADITRDCREDPERYLAETIVPAGGE
ncbi:hypothetical protein L6R52_05440 [Myxococcota bacterium]|nr:hypothetical protein [Myxococcota bacterium]